MTGAETRRRVLVTRAEPDATETARVLEASGYQPLIVPLSEIRPLPVELSALPPDLATVATTSANAVRNLPHPLASALKSAHCYCVGEKTAEAARRAGFADIVEGRGDAEQLAAAIIASGAPGPVVYLCGRLRRPTFEAALASAGIKVLPLETYDTVAAPLDEATALEALGGMAVDAALVYSLTAAEALARLSRLPAVSRLLETTEICCISGRVAAELRSSGFTRVRTATEPTEAGLLSILGNPT